MKLPFLIILLAASMLLAACSKDKYTTNPKLEFKSVNGSSFAPGSNVSFNFVVTDKEGDIQDSMWIQKISLICPDTNTEKPTLFKLPVITGSKNLNVELSVNYTYELSGSGSYPPIDRSLCAQLRNDSLYFRFWIRDVAGHVSDTVTSPTITLLKE